ncbi:Aste57867_24441 [Aphanomyces stellatus]|uniref:Aste57867_24441 protein n=1 Tax=Aphanomyces stellatus TaxID=120398 RepID=A0A485LRH9_9STRA|nr:hypothetical protein As57867_024365 [Aphanomyces stellatus]VFU01081.1 Aste57867_24441 [Aphanomyces stellatus]
MDTWVAPLVLNLTDSKAIRGLVLRNTGGYVHEDPVNTHPSVVFRASNNNVMAAINIAVASTATMDVLTIEFDNLGSLPVAGSYVLDVYVPTQSLQYLETTDDGDTVVYPNTLNTDATQDLTILASGRGNVFVLARDLIANDMLLAARSSGAVQLAIEQTVVASKMNLVSSNAGVVTLASFTTTADELNTLTLGHGNVVVAATKSLGVNAMSSRALGDGAILFATPGACNSSAIETVAGGEVFANLVDCLDTKVSLGGSGDVYLSSTYSLDVTDIGLGDVYASVSAVTAATGPFSRVPDTFTVPVYDILTVPSEVIQFIELAAGSGDATNDMTTIPPRDTTTKADASSTDVGLLVFAIVLFIVAAASYTLYRLKKLRHTKLSIEDKLADAGFATVGTPKEPTTLSL